MSDDYLEDLRNWIFESAGLGLSDVQIKTWLESDNVVDPTVTLYTGVNEKGERTHDQPKAAIEYPHAQITVRSRNVKDAHRVAKRIYDFFNDNYPPYPYETIYPDFRPFRLGPPDSNGRWAVGFSVRMQMID